MRILLVEDDENLGWATADGLRESFAVDWVTSSEKARAALVVADYDLLVLDVVLPGQSGVNFLRSLRQEKNSLPVLLLTARDAIEHRVAGLNAGADDYLVKPFDLDELIARCNALIRRAHGQIANVIEWGNLRFDIDSRNVSRNDQDIPLSGRERDILHVLMSHIGRAVSKSYIESHIYDWSSELIESNTVEVHISALRKKLGRELITTLRGVGYMIPRCRENPTHSHDV
ncbi:MAG: DNA-binding response regulator [marine bacterium B5-7]|nr:MAG: DNA-binding response regulator [marine bacterium B5-7]